jgi:nitrate reductase gamma subunit
MSKVLILVAALLAPGTAAAYMGPGAGLGMLGSLVAVVAAVALAVLGLVLLPVRMILKRRRRASAKP